jgi:recombinational DNA repair protein RecT
MAETQIAVTEKSVGQYVQDTLPALIKSYAVRAYDGNAWMKTAALCIVENPELMACLQTEAEKISLKHALRFAATTGLSLNPQEGMAALVPIKGKVSYWPMKNGLVELALETGKVKAIRMNAVHAQDHFKLMETMDGDTYEFSPNVKTRGEIIGFFCAIRLVEGPSLVEYMTREEMEAWRKEKSPNASMALEGYGLKTVTKRACNRIKLPAAEAPALKAALSDAEPADFTVAPTPQKGASAADVEAKLKSTTTAREDSSPAPAQPAAQSSEPAPTPPPAPAPAASAAPAGAPAASVASGAPGSAEQPELGLPGGEKKEIF